MNQSEYQKDLMACLRKHSDAVGSKIRELLKHIPDDATSLDLVVFPRQDGEGDFSVYASVDGPNLYVLNKPLEPFAELITVVNTPNGFDPPVPMMNAFDTEFDVNDVLTNTVAHWLHQVWEAAGLHSPDIPTTIVGDDGYGTTTPIALDSTARK